MKIRDLLNDKNIKIVSSKDDLLEIISIDWSKDIVNGKRKVKIKSKNKKGGSK